MRNIVDLNVYMDVEIRPLYQVDVDTGLNARYQVASKHLRGK